VGLASDAIEQGLWTPQDAASADLPARFGFVRNPTALSSKIVPSNQN
jgi:hypothetical protein